MSFQAFAAMIGDIIALSEENYETFKAEMLAKAADPELFRKIFRYTDRARR